MDTALITEKLYSNPKSRTLPLDEDDTKNTQFIKFKENDDDSDDIKVGDDKKNIKLIPVTRKIMIDSVFRDKIIYPDASEFVVSWGRSFTNVAKMRITSLEFPNVVPCFHKSNNTLYWINKEDFDLEPPFPVYTAVIDTGSYTISTLEIELTNIMKMSKRHFGQVSLISGEKAQNHYFMVTLNNESDKVSFTSIITKNAPVSPFTTIAGSNIVQCYQPDHGYESGEIIYFIGVMGIIGGISATDILNTGFKITKNDNNYFSFEVNSNAITSTSGGGSQVKTGRGAPFQFLFGNYDNVPADELGFPVENSSDNLSYINPITSSIRIIQGMEIDKINYGYLKIISQNHELEVGDDVYIYNLIATPDIYNDINHKGAYKVIAVLTPDVFLVDCKLLSITSWAQSFIGTRIFHMYFPNHTFYRITEIKQVAPDIIQISTLFGHGITENNTWTRISETNCDPSIDGVYEATRINDDTFTITIPGINLNSPGYTGILTTDHLFYLYNVQPFAGFSYNELNGKPFTIRKILNENEFIFVGKYGFASKEETGGGDGIRISSKLHGWNETHDNFINNALYKPIRLSGDDYVFMCIPNLKSDSISSNCPVQNIFAKIYITANPGQVIFHEFDASDVEFNTPIKKVDELKIQIKSKNNELISFNGLDFSFSLEVVELIRRDITVEYSRNANGYAGLI